MRSFCLLDEGCCRRAGLWVAWLGSLWRVRPALHTDGGRHMLTEEHHMILMFANEISHEINLTLYLGLPKARESEDCLRST